MPTEKHNQNGYVMLPCFTVEVIDGCTPDLTCNRILSFIFEVFFAPFWDGKIYLYSDNHSQ